MCSTSDTNGDAAVERNRPDTLSSVTPESASVAVEEMLNTPPSATMMRGTDLKVAVSVTANVPFETMMSPVVPFARVLKLQV